MSMLLVHELHEARDRVLLLVQRLKASRDSELVGYRAVLDEEIVALDTALEQAKIPDRYRVAVVGRFKVGKSSFVNRLAQERLAGVETSPETAAISVFRYGDDARAEVEFVSREEWENLRNLYEESPDNQEAKRYAGFVKFNERGTGRDKEPKERHIARFDLDELLTKWVTPGGKVHGLQASSWWTVEGKKQFRKELRAFTSSQEPLHYLVNKLTIYAPIPILGDHIELVDTPGLDDTEHFRVVLTEDLVREVDAILFLTTSGASYGQSDKEFLIRQLRRKQIKHLQIIVTKSDETYENAVRDAKNNEDDVPSFEAFREKEIGRVRGEIKKTLDELLKVNSLSDDDGYYFMEQLEAVPIFLISTKFHDDGAAERGGIDAVRDGLYQILSTSHRFEQSRQVLTDRLDASLRRLRSRYSERLSAIESHYDSQKIKVEIESIRAGLGAKLSFFDEEASRLVEVLSQQQRAFTEQLPIHLENIEYRGREVVDEFEKTDLGRHWRTRRAGYWGYLSDLQNRIADRIFPKVEARLNELRKQLDEFMSNMRTRLEAFQDRVKSIESDHQLIGLEPMALAEAQQPLIEEIAKQFQGNSEDDRNHIINRLDEFVTAQVRTRLEKARVAVTFVEGSGTTTRQSDEVQSFYGTVKSLLMKALLSHLEARFEQYASAILENAKSVAPRIREKTLAMVEQRMKAIESTLALASAEERKRVTAYLEEMRAMTANFAADPKALASASQDHVDHDRHASIQPMTADSRQWQSATELVSRRFEILDGETGHTYESLFRPYLDHAERIVVEDPYIRLQYQVNNFARFCALANRLGTVKSIELISGQRFGEDTDDADSRLENLRRDLLMRGVDLVFSRRDGLHDREIRLSNGWVIKIGRGLDIYYPPESWVSVEAQDFSLRRCKQTRVDIFREDMAKPQGT